jgi:hypothetical protein
MGRIVRTESVAHPSSSQRSVRRPSLGISWPIFMIMIHFHPTLQIRMTRQEPYLHFVTRLHNLVLYWAQLKLTQCAWTSVTYWEYHQCSYFGVKYLVVIKSFDLMYCLHLQGSSIRSSACRDNALSGQIWAWPTYFATIFLLQLLKGLHSPCPVCWMAETLNQYTAQHHKYTIIISKTTTDKAWNHMCIYIYIYIYIYFPVALRPDTGWWPPLTGLHDHTRTHLTE